jgi:secondary thiamine-phosphate synthase enzyme
MTADRSPSSPLRQALGRLEVATRPRALADVTAAVDRWLADVGAGDGLLTLFLRHTSASLTIQENASPEVLPDLVDALDRAGRRRRRRRRRWARGR